MRSLNKFRDPMLSHYLVRYPLQKLGNKMNDIRTWVISYNSSSIWTVKFYLLLICWNIVLLYNIMYNIYLCIILYKQWKKALSKLTTRRFPSPHLKSVKMCFFSSKNMPNVLKHMKKQFYDFRDFYCLRNGRFCTQNT